MRIHQWAIVDPKAELADDVEIDAFSIIGPHVSIGKGTRIGPHCVITGRAVIGEFNQFFSGAQIGILCQDRKHKEGLIGRVQIGDHNQFREHVTVSASTMSSYDDDHRVTIIGSNSLFMACTHVAHDCHLGDQIIMSNNAMLGGHVDVEDGAILSGGCGVHQECVIGRLAFIGGMTRVTKDVPPFMLVEGNPARCYGPNSVGLRRAGYSQEARARIKTMYKILYWSDLNTTQALQDIETRVEDSVERNQFIDFVRKSIRGCITKAAESAAPVP